MMQELTLRRLTRPSAAEGVEIVEFVLDGSDLVCPYFHQRFFTHDSERFICAGRFDDQTEAVLIDIPTGAAWRLTEGGAAVEIGDLAPDGRLFHFVRGAVVFTVDIETGEETERFALPTDGGYECMPLIHLSADGSRIVVGANREHASGVKEGCVFTLDADSGRARKLIERPFQIGHVQWSTTDPTLVMYCHETGGASPQRMWLARTTEVHPGPLFDRPGHPWVTHETFTGDGSAVVFIRNPEGMGVIRPGNTRFQSIKSPSAWHPGPNRDGSVIVHDTHRGELKLHWRAGGRSVLLAEGELATGTKHHAHPRFAPNDRMVIWTSSHEAPTRPVVADVSALLA